MSGPSMSHPGFGKSIAGKGPRTKRKARAERARQERMAADRETHRMWLGTGGSR